MPMRFLATFLGSIALVSCTVRGNLPDFRSDSSCDPGYDERTPPFCDWAGSLDAIVTAKVEALAWSYDDPVSLATGADADEGCAPVNGILVIDLELTSALSGPHRAGERLRVIAQDSGYWSPRPVKDDTDPETVHWSGGAAPAILVGQEIGVALRQEPGGDRWATRADPFFIQEQGTVRFSKMEGFCWVYPVRSGDFATLAELEKAIEACPSASAAALDRKGALSADGGWRPVCLDRESIETSEGEAE